MNQFVISDDGTVREFGVEQFSKEVQQDYPNLDLLAWEGTVELARAHSTLNLLLSPVYEKAGLTSARGGVLTHLFRSPTRRLSVGEIASAMNVTSGNVTQVVSGLEKKALVKRYRDPADGRGTIVELTKEGIETLQAIRPSQVERITLLWAGLTEKEKALLIHLLAKLRMVFLATIELPSPSDL